MKKQLIGFILPFLICTLMPLGATAQFELLISSSPTPWSAPITVSVSQNGNPVVGQAVTFSMTSAGDGNASLSATSATTDSNGEAKVTVNFESGGSGSYEVTASVGTDSASITVARPELPVVSIIVVPPGPRLTISVISFLGSGEPGETLTFIVEVRVDDSPTSGKTVTFSITSGGGNASLGTTSATTGSDGRAQTTLILGSGASGSYTVTASVDSKSTSSTVIIGTSPPPPPPPPPPELSISVVSGPGSGAPGETLTFTVEVQEDGSAASGKTVTFSITSGDGNASLGTTSTTTGSNGRAQTTLTLGGSASGSYTITATVGSKSTSGTATVEISPPPPPPPPPPELSISVVSGPGSGAPGDALAFTVEVQEGGSAASGKTVTFSITSGDGNASLGTTSTTTGSNGRAQTTLTLGGSASGSYTITATVSSKSTSGTATVETSPPPPPPPPPPELSISVVSGPGSGAPGDALTFTVEVQEGGSAASGKTVTFSITSGDGNASLGTTSTTTGSNGRAQTTLTLGGSASGSYTITATVGSKSTSGTATVNTPPPPPPPQDNQQQQEQQNNQQQQQQQNQQQQQEPSTPTPPLPMPTTLEGVSGDNQTGLAGETLANPFVIEVRDQNGAPMEGVTVTFTISAGGGSLSDTNVDTDANGLAQSTLILGTDPGTNTVEVSAEGISQMPVFSAEATLPPPMPTALSIISGDNQTSLTGETLMNSFVVEIRDQYGDPMEGVTVSFAVSAGGGSLSETSVETDANGLAQSTLTLGSDPGTNTVDVSVEGITETATFNAVAELLEFDLSLPSGISLIHVPLRVRTVDGEAQIIELVGDLYTALGGVDAVNWLITRDSESQDWDSYFGDSDRGTVADKVLTDDTGIITSMKAPVSVRLSGDALGVDGMSTITLNQGLNLVGLPLKDSRVTRVSDLFALAGIADNVPVIIVSDNGEFKAVGRTGDPGDIEITGGQSFILTAQGAATLTISGDGWDNAASGMMAAPPIAMRGIQTTEVTPVLALSGSIVDGVRSINGASFRVIVKNLSTGSAVTTVVGDTSSTSSQVGYQLTVVDIADGRAAAIGDTLEISVKSTDASIGVQPLRYTLTVEDVRLSRVELPALFLHEIPVETELVRNYPNPFNPETWIPYRLAQDAFVTLTIYDGNGQMVRTLDVGHQTAAVYENRSRAAYWDGRNYVGESVASGVYFYTLTAGDFSATRKMVILK